jgi:hypothetical protein
MTYTEAIDQLALAKQLKDEAAALTVSATATLIDHMRSTGLRRLRSDTHHATVSYIAPGKSKRFDKDKAKQSLLMRGVAADVIQESFDGAVTESDKSEYITFTVDK